jgi:hypothetical protein
MRFVCGDVRVLIVSYKNDHGPSRCRYRALQWQRFLKICFREIYGVVRFSTFATISAKFGSRLVLFNRSLRLYGMTRLRTRHLRRFQNGADLQNRQRSDRFS